jgi:bifunctional non-homologous end joining protein LigD
MVRAKAGRAGDAASPERLARYRGKRDFRRTPEPSGETGPAGPEGGLRFVVQRHRARRLHYDLRFEMGGVLASWAVPKGPTLDPSVKRAAVHVEDHPIEYVDFEGVIPAGEYGGGDVIVWDRGTWEPHGTADPVQAVAAGELHADVHGAKLRGRLVLVRRGSVDGGRDGREDWLLLHKRDRYAVEGWDPEEHPRSVLSGRTNEEVKADPDRMWRSDLPAAQAAVSLRDPVPEGPGEEELAALDSFGATGTWSVFGRALRVTNLDKVLFPGRPGEPAVSKREFLRYSARVAPLLLPYLAGRPLNMHRYPGGAGSQGFWHKQLPDHAPAWVPRWTNPQADPGQTTTYLVVDEPAALVWAANFGALEWHAWTSRAESPEQPSYALIDIDPGSATRWADVLALARLHRTALEHLGVRGVAKVTGRRGIQVWIPIAPGPGFDETREWVHQLSRAIGATVPDLVSWEWEVNRRGGQARLDYTQNAINKTLVAPYSPRPAAGGPVSAPISWPELDDPTLRPDGFTIRTLPERLAGVGDLFRPVLSDGQRLPAIR